MSSDGSILEEDLKRSIRIIESLEQYYSKKIVGQKSLFYSFIYFFNGKWASFG